MPRFANLVVYAFSSVVIPWGLSGMLFAQFWLKTILRVPLDLFEPVVRASFVSEFRFLQARELAVGVLALVFCERIVTERVANRAFLAMVAAVPLVRGLSWLIDGSPRPMLIAFAGTEVFMTALLWWATRRTTT